jgi:hypothetical protein
MGKEGGFVTARIESPRLMRKSAARNIESVIDTIRISRIRIDRWWRTSDEHLKISTRW